jgi:hypothetical protein
MAEEDKFVVEAKDKEEAEEEIEEELDKEDPEYEEKPKGNPIKNFFKKIYNFLWVDESVLSYVVFIIIAFLLLRFIAFPAFLMVSGYADVAAVVSGSMSHSGPQSNYTFNEWLNFHNYSAEQVAGWPFVTGLEVGDVIAVRAIPAENIHVGDIVLFYSSKGQIIHRVIAVKQLNGQYFYTTKGDANAASSPTEKDIPYTEIKGKLADRIPYLGYPKVAFSYIIPWL